MFIALQHRTFALQRSAMCFRSVYMPLLTERDRLGIWGYKHVAPPEQEPAIPTSKNLRYQRARTHDTNEQESTIPMLTTFRASRLIKDLHVEVQF